MKNKYTLGRHISYTFFIASCLFAHAFVYGKPVENRPNIIYINADDLGVMDVGFNSKRYHTPNIDQLKNQGMLFTNAYAPASNCAPSRANVFSGQYGPRHGVYTVKSSARGRTKDRKLIPIKNTLRLKPDNITLAHALQSGGYKTIHLGKWHVTKDPLKSGFDINIGGDENGGPNAGGGYFSPFKGIMQPWNDLYPKGTHRVDVFADQAIKFMKANKDREFFVHMSYYSVHTKLEAVPELVHKYKGKGVDVKYASMIEKMDEGIGKILSELEVLGLADKTLVLFSSDNGGVKKISSQNPYRSGKGSYFEGGIREPLIVRWPGKVAAGSISDTPVSGIDFYPTFLDVTGTPVPKGKLLDGQSFLPLLMQKGDFPERALFWHFPIYLDNSSREADAHDVVFRTRPGSVIRRGQWKLHEYFEDGRIELYNLETDLGERNNLALSEPKIAEKLHIELKQWRKQIGAPVPTKLNPGYVPKAKKLEKK